MAGLIYTSTKSKPKKKSKSKKLALAKSKHEDFLRRFGVPTERSSKHKKGIVAIPNLREGLDRGAAPTSDNVPGGVIEHRDIFTDHKWKPGKQEKQETIDEINRKAASVAPAYNKGGLVYNYDRPEDRRKQ